MWVCLSSVVKEPKIVSTVFNHTYLWFQVRQAVDVLAGVPAVWDAEANLKVKGFEQEVSEKVPLN